MYTHFVFNLYKGKHFLSSDEFKKFLNEYFNEIANRNGLKILALNILADHVHVLIEHPFMPYSKIMKNIKGASSRQFFLVFPSNRLVDRKLWGRSYHYKKVQKEGLPSIIKYIKEQTVSGYDKRYI